MRNYCKRLAVTVFSVVAIAHGSMAWSQIVETTDENSPEQTWTVNFKETDIEELIRFVAKASGKTIIIADKITGKKVQVISSEPVTTDELYQLFLSILDIHGFAAVE